MGLLELLFPELENCNSKDLPNWEDSEHPWEIFEGQNSIKQQLEELFGKNEIFIHPSAKIGDFVKIEGPCYIGSEVEIRHAAFLRSGSWICEGAVVGHCSEVKNSILLPGSKAPHFNYVGDSILGFGVNLGAGSILSNVRNDRREIVAFLGDGERVETGLRKFGALVGDLSQIGCNVVTNPGTIVTPGKLIPPNKTISRWH
jgi:NDP-sugar pyrophosphorylase family protein